MHVTIKPCFVTQALPPLASLDENTFSNLKPISYLESKMYLLFTVQLSLIISIHVLKHQMFILKSVFTREHLTSEDHEIRGRVIKLLSEVLGKLPNTVLSPMEGILKKKIMIFEISACKKKLYRYICLYVTGK